MTNKTDEVRFLTSLKNAFLTAFDLGQIHRFHPLFQEFLDQQANKVEEFFENLVSDARERMDLISDQVDIYEKLRAFKKGTLESGSVVLIQKQHSKLRQRLDSILNFSRLQPAYHIPARKSVPTDAYTPMVSYRKLKSKLKTVCLSAFFLHSIDVCKFANCFN